MTRALPTPTLLSPPPLPEALVSAHGPAVWALCRRLSPDPEDAYQDVWEKVLSRRGAYQADRGSVRTWVLTVAHRRLVDRHRRRRVRGPVAPLTDVVGGGPSPDEQLAARRRQDRLERALAQLPEGQRRVVVSHHIHGLSLASIATADGVAVGTFKSRLHRGRAALAALVEGSNDR